MIRARMLTGVAFALLLVGPSPLALAQSNSPSIATGTADQHVWSHPGAWWIGEQVSFGNHGTQVFTHYAQNDTATALLSVHDNAPAVPVWELDTDPDNPKMVDSARYSDAHVSISQTQTSTLNQNIIKVRKLSAQGLDWTYTFPHLTAGRLVTGISGDGQTIVAAIPNPVTQTNDLLVFSAGSPVPVAMHSLPVGTIWGFTMATEGNVAAFAIDSTLYVLEISSGNILLTVPQSTSYSNLGLALSGDGSVLAHGVLGSGFTLYRRTSASYAPVWFRPTPSHVRVIDISDDSSTVAYGMGFLYPSTRIIVECVDIPTLTVTMSEDISGGGQYQNTVHDLALSANGNVCAAATFGGELGINAELRIYSKYSNTPIRTLDLPGSAFSVDISPDGKWVVAGSKAIHANELGHGGQVDLLHLGGADFAMHTTPSIGNTVNFEAYGAPNSPAFLLHATLPSDPSVLIPAIGSLYLKRAAISLHSMGAVSALGSANLDWPIANDPGLIGVTHYFQGYLLAPRKLTADWLPVTYLP